MIFVSRPGKKKRQKKKEEDEGEEQVEEEQWAEEEWPQWTEWNEAWEQPPEWQWDESEGPWDPWTGDVPSWYASYGSQETTGYVASDDSAPTSDKSCHFVGAEFFSSSHLRGLGSRASGSLASCLRHP